MKLFLCLLTFTPLCFFGAHVHPGVIRCLSSGSTRDNGAGCGRNNRCSAGDPIDASPAVAHPDNAWDDIIRHVSSGLELAALVGNDNWGIARDVSFLRIPGMNPELRPRVGFGKRWERLAFIKERMKGREGTSLTETQRILCLSWSGIGWQGREPGLAGTLAPEFDFVGGRGKGVVLVGDMRETVLRPVAATPAKLGDGQRLAIGCLFPGQPRVHIVFFVAPRQE